MRRMFSEKQVKNIVNQGIENGEVKIPQPKKIQLIGNIQDDNEHFYILNWSTFDEEFYKKDGTKTITIFVPSTDTGSVVKGTITLTLYQGEWDNQIAISLEGATPDAHTIYLVIEDEEIMFWEA